jgi:hypothetical protein
MDDVVQIWGTVRSEGAVLAVRRLLQATPGRPAPAWKCLGYLYQGRGVHSSEIATSGFATW